MSVTRIHTVGGGIDVDVSVDHDDLYTTLTALPINPYSSLITAIRSVSGAIGVPVAEIIRLIEEEEA